MARSEPEPELAAAGEHFPAGEPAPPAPFTSPAFTAEAETPPIEAAPTAFGQARRRLASIRESIAEGRTADARREVQRGLRELLTSRPVPPPGVPPESTSPGRFERSTETAQAPEPALEGAEAPPERGQWGFEGSESDPDQRDTSFRGNF
jgi:hypothetical protein